MVSHRHDRAHTGRAYDVYYRPTEPGVLAEDVIVAVLKTVRETIADNGVAGLPRLIRLLPLGSPAPDNTRW